MHEIPVQQRSLRGRPATSHAGNPRTRALRSRLLAVLALAATGGASGCGGGYHCPDTDGSEVRTTATLYLADATETCPADPTVSYLDLPYDGAYYLTDCRDPALTGQDGVICTYDITCTEQYCCGYGRPYFDAEGQAVIPDCTDDPAWLADLAVALDELSPAERDALAAFWLKNAQAEHSSVAGFHRFALDLLAHGAPPELILAAQDAATQEVRHAMDCFALASAYAGRALGPTPLALGTHAPIASSLAELAAWTVRDGAVGETVAAYLASEALERATDPAVRAALEVVVEDETAHAELAWKTLAWALDVGGDEVRRAVIAVFATLAEDRDPEGATTAGMVAHGMLPAGARQAAVSRCLDEVIRPVLASLLARDLAA